MKMPATPMDIQLQDIRLVNQIGEGGMSTVWKAMDLQRNEIVAVKILDTGLTENKSDLEQFIAEEKAMEEISHPCIVKSYGMRRSNGFWYFEMEYVDGYNFGDLLRRKQHLPESDCLLICESIATALDYAWNEHGMVHCDIKPENIMINREGVVKLTDLGLCYRYKWLNDGQKDVPDQVMGTPAYISPEQIYGDVEPDCRADIYSLAATLYHLSTGRVLFPGRDAEDMMRAHCSVDCKAKDPRVYCPSISEGFCQMLEAMLVKDRNDRLSNWTDVLTMCREVENGSAFKPRPTSGPSSMNLERSE